MNYFLRLNITLLIIIPCFLLSQPISLGRLSRQCIEIWRMMSDLVEQKDYFSATEPNESQDFLDQILCGLVKIRDTISQLKNNHEFDHSAAEYVESSLDCIESYSYDLVQHYPGSWSTVIQDQVFRTQQEYAQYLVP
jgi:hypothetical protein